MSNNPITLPDVAQTGLLTLYCHVIESGNPDPILRDEKAVEIARQLDPLLAGSSNRLLRKLAKRGLRQNLVFYISMRAKRYDEYAVSFFKEHPEGVLVHIGCGMDSRFQRIDNGRLTCFDLDLPEMINFKRQFFEETERYHLIPASVFDPGWMDQVSKSGRGPVLFMAEGVFMYLDSAKVKELILTLQSRFPGSELVCEVVKELFTRKPWNRMVSIKLNQQMGVGKDAAFNFGIRNSREMESWGKGIEYLDEWNYFDSGHPRLGGMAALGKIKFMREVQYTVHYRLR